MHVVTLSSLFTLSSLSWKLFVSIPLCNVVDKAELCTLELHHFGLLENGVYKGGKVCYVDNCIHDYMSLLDLKKIGIDLGYKVDITQRVTNLKVYYKGHEKVVWVLYYHDPTHNNEIKSEDKEQQQQSEDVGNEEEEEEEDEEKEDVIVDSDYELSEEENGNKEAASRAQPRNDAPNVEYTQCFEEMNEISGGEEDGQKKTSKRKWKKPNFKQFRKETDLRNPEFRIGMHFANNDELKGAIMEYAIVQGRNVKLIRKNPEWDVGAFQSEVLEKYHMNVSRHQIYKAKSLSKVIIEGSYVEQNARL
ncbi:unnamed protein product [Prunus armeniaca]